MNFSFGVIADVQYADKENAEASEGNGRVKRFREAPGKLAKAVNFFNNNSNQLKFVLSLGDIIDGNITAEKTRQDFDIVLDELRKLELPAVHVLGNHCLSLPRETLMADLGMPAAYYVHAICQGWALIVLDTMDMSVKWPEETQNFKEAMEFLHTHPFSQEHPQMDSYNGGLGETQLAWLQGVISDAERDGTKLIVAAHHPLVAGSAPESLLVWNHQQVSSILLESPAVVLYLCGHYHPGGYKRVKNKHFVTIQAILEAPTDSEAHAVVNIHENKVFIEGIGTVTSRELDIGAVH